MFCYSLLAELKGRRKNELSPYPLLGSWLMPLQQSIDKHEKRTTNLFNQNFM
jgi:hypothetical protein